MSTSGSSSLRPAWKGGRGFQPPPTVTSEAKQTQQQQQQQQQQSKRDTNKFSALDEDEDDFVPVSSGSKRSNRRSNTDSSNDNNNSNEPKQNSRSEAFRSSFEGGGGGGRRTSKGGGRTLADLAARVPEGVARSSSTGYSNASAGASAGSRFSGLRSGSTGDPTQDAAGGGGPPPMSEYKKAVETAKVKKYTREKLLSIRPRPCPDAAPPEQLQQLDESSIVLTYDTPQDPVCWDAFDADEIWATVPSRRTTAAPGLSKGATGETGVRRSSNRGGGGGRWERGVALPPPGEGGKRGSNKDADASNPNELWDDPQGNEGVAMDFSAFGGMPEGDLGGGAGGGGDAFDFEKMAEASRKFEEELHGSRGSEDIGDNEDEDQDGYQVKVDPKRPLASAGTTIRSGSGDDVNVFEDFDAPTGDEVEPIKTGSDAPAGDEDATSRLMAMIGVKKDGDASAALAAAAAGDQSAPTADGGLHNLLGLAGGGPALSLNPWGDPIIPGAGGAQPAAGGLGMDLASRLESFAAEQKAREAAELQQKELLRRQQEEAQRRALAQKQQQAQERARQEAMQQQQQNSPQNQVELVLMERISTILENSWGRSDLMSILSTLHAEDSRVIPLLSNVDLLRDLIAHNPRRVALRKDPAFGTEMAVLVMTNAQWQQQQQQEAQARAQQEELRRREEQLRMQQDLQRQRSLSENPPRVNPDAPWFYSDPQGNIQGPFRSDEMRQWLEAGYFKGDLPISQQASGPFIPLSAIFPDLSVAFQTQQTDTAQEEAASRARAEEERRRAEELEKQRLAEQEAREAAERQRREMAAAASKQNEDSQNQSAQLKMMLGLSSQQQQQQQQQPTQPEAAPAPAEKPKAAEKQPTEKRPSKAEKSNNKQKKEFAPAPAPAEEAPKVPAPTAKPATPAWGGAAQVAPATRKSMSDIQKEEARRAAQLAAQQGNQPRQSSGWANVAAAGKSSWTPSAVKPTAAAVVGANAAAVVNARAAGQSGGARPNRQPTPTGQQRKAGTQPQQTQRTNSKSSTAEEFGASMSPQLESWCKDQMQKLNGTDDLTLVAFCMTLSDPSEIRQYLTTYLGSTPQVNKFANEFISKKGGGGSQQEEWETPGSAKKGKKKKAR